MPETIKMMRDAGISVWMLTGDKQETAINIGFSCNLIDQTQKLFSLDTDSLESTREQLQVRQVTKTSVNLVIEFNVMKLALTVHFRHIEIKSPSPIVGAISKKWRSS